MKAIALEPIRYNGQRIEAGEEFDIDNETWQKIKNKNIAKIPKFGSQSEIKFENKVEKKGGK